MKMRTSLRMFLLVAAVVAAVSIGWALDVHAQGAPQSAPQMGSGLRGMQHEVHGMVKDLDPSGKSLTLDDGTRLTIPPTVQLPGGIKEGSIVKASFEERAGEKVVTSLEIQTP
jgi:Cu/Ag efflux protein CusF